VIGNITDQEGKALLVGEDGTGIPLKAQGWNAYGTSKEE
jgi:hypothetical protein